MHLRNGNKTFYIRADGNEIIATGHIMRCLSIAEEIRNLGINVTFLLADDKMRDTIESKGFEVSVLDTAWDNLDAETDVICDYLKENEVKHLLVDSYSVTEKYLGEISKCSNVIYIDDILKFPYDVHTIINYNVFEDGKSYDKLYEEVERKPEFLTGGQYVPLRREFSDSDYQVRDEARRILITTGGADKYNVALKVIEKALSDNDLKDKGYYVIAGRFNSNNEKLKGVSNNYPNIKIFENVTDMSNKMKECDIAVSAGGTTLCEIAACGTPAVCLEIADNQRGARRWGEEGYMIYAGNAETDLEACVNNCIDALKTYINNYELRKKNSELARNLVDGKGSQRIAKYIERIMMEG